MTTVSELEGRYSFSPSQVDYEELLTLEPDRPSLAQYLEWMWIEYGTESGAYWDLIKELRTGTDPNRHRFPELPERNKPRWLAAETIAPYLTDGFAVSGGLYRRHFSAYIQLVTWVRRAESSFQSLYRAEKQERYRDFIHLMIHLGEKLPPVPGPGTLDAADCRAHLAELVTAADRAAQVYWAYAQRVFDAAVISNRRANLVAKLGAAKIQSALPGFSNEYYGSGSYDELVEIEQVRVLDAQLDGGNHEGLKFYHHGGAPSRSDVGRGGDALLARQMLDQALRMINLRDKILAVPTMADLIDKANLRSTVQTVVPDDLTAIALKSEKVQREFAERWGEDEQSEPEVMDKLTVTIDDLRVGDIIIGGNLRKGDEPLRVERLLGKGNVLLANQNVAVPISRTDSTIDSSIIIERPRVANTH